MATQVQIRRGTTAQHASFTGAAGELTVDTDKKAVVVHDGSTAGGIVMLRADQSNLPTSAPTTGLYTSSGSAVISTGGQGRLLVDANGNVAVNLGISGGPGALVSTQAGFSVIGGTSVLSTDPGVITIGANNNSVSSNDVLGRIRFCSNDASISMAGSVGKIECIATGNFSGTAPTALTFFTNNGIAGGESERLRITSTGDVNIKGAGTAGSTQAVSFNGSAPVNSLVVDSSGRVGVGTSSPAAIIDAKSSSTIDSAAYYNVIVRSSDSYTTAPKAGIGFAADFGSNNLPLSAIWGGKENTTLNDFGSTLSLGTRLNGGNITARLHITSAGLVGIGSTGPLAPLHIEKALPANDAQSAAVILSRTSNIGSAIYHTYSSALVGEAAGISVHGGTSLTDTSYTKYLVSQNGTHVWYGPTTSNERARIDSSGRLLVGTSSSLSNAVEGGVQIVGTGADAYLTLTRFNASALTPAGIVLGRSKSGTKGTNTAVADGDFLGIVEFTGADGGTSYRSAAHIAAYVDGAVSGGGAADMPGRLVFSTTADGESSPTERMRITNGGAFKASTNGSYNEATVAYHEFYQSANARTLYVRNINASLANPILNIYADRNTSNGTYNFIEAGIQGTANRFIVADSGNVTNTNNSYGAISDAKLKDNIVDASSQWDDIKGLQVRKYKFKEETGQPTHTQIGLVAQEVELVSPGLVGESIDRDAEGNDLGTVTKSVNYSVLYMKAVKALQEAMERIETLEAKVAALESA